MYTDVKKLRDKIKQSIRCIGPSISLSDPTVTELLAESVDFVWIDLEHTALSLESLQSHLIAARAGGVPALVRIPGLDVTWIKRVLDMGAAGIICPQIGGVEDACRFISACRYPPAGTRGYGPRRPSHYGRLASEDSVRQGNDEIFVVVQIERRQAVEQLDDILALPGLSSIVVGPYDLSGDYGKLGQLRDSQFVEITKSVIHRARQAGICIGYAMGLDVEYAREVFDLGVNWIQFGADYQYLHAFADEMYVRIRG